MIMLEANLLRDLINKVKGCHLRNNEVVFPLIYHKMERGQKVYRFNRNNDGLEVLVFNCFIENLSGGFTAVISKGENTHPSNLFISTYFCRDLCFGFGGDYPSESYYLCEDQAKRKLKTYLKRKLEKSIESLN